MRNFLTARPSIRLPCWVSTAQAFESQQQRYLAYMPEGPWHFDRSLIPASIAARVAAYDRAAADLSAALDRFAVRYVALPAGKKPDYLARGWTLLVNGPTWDVWERNRK